MQKITPFLWYSNEAEEAAAFYASIFPDSRVVRVTALPSHPRERLVATRRLLGLCDDHRLGFGELLRFE